MSWRFFSGVTFVLFCFAFCLYAIVEAAALRSIVLRYAGVPIATSVSFFLFFSYFVYLEMSFFPSIFVPFPLSLCMDYRVRRTFFPSGWCFSYLVTRGWIFYISLCENSINQSINQHLNSQKKQSTALRRRNALLLGHNTITIICTSISTPPCNH